MFFFIGGIQSKTRILDKRPQPCSVCGRTQVYKKRVDTYLSLFFIPLIPVKKGFPFSACENCGSVFKLDGSRIDVPIPEKAMRCRRCGGHVGPDFSYCPYCGHSL